MVNCFYEKIRGKSILFLPRRENSPSDYHLITILFKSISIWCSKSLLIQPSKHDFHQSFIAPQDFLISHIAKRLWKRTFLFGSSVTYVSFQASHVGLVLHRKEKLRIKNIPFTLLFLLRLMTLTSHQLYVTTIKHRSW